MTSKPEGELAKVTLGLPGVAAAEIRVRRSLFASIRAFFTKTPEARLFAVPWMRAQVFTAAEDDGWLDIYLDALNMSPHDARVEHLFLERIAASGNDLGMMAPMFTPPDAPIGPYAIQRLYFRMPLTAPSIRLLLRVVQKAQNLLSTPRMELMVAGILELTVRQRRVRVRFTVASQPEIDFRCPGANA